MPVNLKGLKFFSYLSVTLLMVLVLLNVPAFSNEIPYPDALRISTGDLKKMLGDSNLVIIDVRIDSQWQSSDIKIPNAVHENPANIDWSDKYPKDSVIVTY